MTPYASGPEVLLFAIIWFLMLAPLAFSLATTFRLFTEGRGASALLLLLVNFGVTYTILEVAL